jgi:hypothetical protein
MMARVKMIVEGALVPMPVSITARIGEALAALFRHPERALLPWYRYAIYAELTPDNHVDGQAARAWLDILAVRRVLFCWQPSQGWPDAWLQPGQLLGLAEELVQRAADRSYARTTVNRAQALADVAGEEPTSPHYCSWCVYEAALRALHNAWAYSQLCAGRTADNSAVSTDDACTYAAIAVAGGTWQPLGAGAGKFGGAWGRWDWQTQEAQLRRAVFWEWWLRDAVPAAWARCA